MHFPTDHVVMYKIGHDYCVLGNIARVLNHVFQMNKPRFKPHVPNEDPDFDGYYSWTRAAVIHKPPPKDLPAKPNFLSVVPSVTPQT